MNSGIPFSVPSGASGDLIFKIRNIGTGVINNIYFDLSSLSIQLQITNVSILPNSTPTNCALTPPSLPYTVPTELLNINLQSGISNEQYLHICYIASCNSSGSLNLNIPFNWGCSSTNFCSNPSYTFGPNINFIQGGTPVATFSTQGKGTPIFSISDYIPNSTITNSYFCGNTTQLSYRIRNTGAILPLHPGYSNLTDLNVYLIVTKQFGTIMGNSYKLSSQNGTSGTTVSINSLSFGMIDISLSNSNYDVYKLDFSGLSINDISGSLGTNSLRDMDFDNKLDDLGELENFVISFDFKYSPTCPNSFTPDIAGSEFIKAEARYNNQCHNMNNLYSNSNPFNFNYNLNFGDNIYSYNNTALQSLLNAPPDVFEGVPFNLTVYPNNIQSWIPDAFNFNCADGYRLITIDLPFGYHINYPSGIPRKK